MCELCDVMKLQKNIAEVFYFEKNIAGVIRNLKKKYYQCKTWPKPKRFLWIFTLGLCSQFTRITLRLISFFANLTASFGFTFSSHPVVCREWKFTFCFLNKQRALEF